MKGKETQLTAASYRAKYLLGGNASFARLRRWIRMLRKEARGAGSK